MTDLVARLRREKENAPPVFPHVALCLEAADKFERLRKAAKDAVDGYDNGDDIFGPMQRLQIVLSLN